MKRVARAVRRWLASAGGFAARQPFDTAVLMYHRFAAERGPSALARADFASQLDWLAANFDVVTLEAALDEPRGARPRVAITIDDGYRGVHDVAWPELRARDLPATVFVPTSFLDEQGWMWQDRNIHLIRSAPAGRWRLDWRGRPVSLDTTSRPRLLDTLVRVYRIGCRLDAAGRRELNAALAATLGGGVADAPPPLYAPMTWEQARGMLGEGCAFGSHTLGHAILTALPEDEAREEIVRSRAVLAERLAAPVTLFAYPNGDFDAATRETVVAAGYGSAVATVPGFWSPRGDRFAVPRIAAPAGDGAELADRLWNYWRRYGAPGPRPASVSG